MVIQPEITFRGMKKDTFLDQHVRDKAAKLERFHDRIIVVRSLYQRLTKKRCSNHGNRYRE